jgi:hypothetical protein
VRRPGESFLKGPPPDNKLCRPIGLATGKVLMIGAERGSVLLARKSSRNS